MVNLGRMQLALTRTEWATVRATPPRTFVEDDGWALCANAGVIDRLNAASTIARGQDFTADKIARAEAFFAKHAIAPAFRVIMSLTPMEVLTALLARGYRAAPGACHIMVRAPGADVFAAPANVTVTRAAQPSEGWQGLFGGKGFDATDSAARVQTYAASAATRFYSVQIEGEIGAVGVTAAYRGACGIHAMRTSPSLRLKGLASALLGAMLYDAALEGADLTFLHVDAANKAAIAVYERLGFETLDHYQYWRLDQAGAAP